MEFRESAKRDLEETISEIASILGEGYLRYRRGRRLPISTPNTAGNVVDPEKVIIRFDSIYESSLTAKVSQKKSA
jgi:hypothetical protein